VSVRRIVPDVVAADPSAGRAFYTGVLGLEVAMDLGWVVTFVSPANPTAQITVVQGQAEAPQPDYTVEVDDVDACYERACAGGSPVLYGPATEPWGVRRFFVRDPHGKVVNVMNHKTG
jgi:catechol 2,3-dioxygenase-like lactoylglutathione lyase family enzyme